MRHKNNEAHGKLRSTFMVIWFFIVFSLFLAAGSSITTYVFKLHLPEVLTHVISGLLAIAMVAVIAGIFRIVGTHSKRYEEYRNINDRMLDAMKQIAQGNFDVLIDPKDAGFHHELAEALNDMSKNLGTLETMRQDFISDVSHEIQSPLTSISGFAALLQRDTLSDEERKHYASIIELESKRLSHLSENLLKLSTLESPDTTLSIQEYRLDKQLEIVALTMEPQWSVKNISLEAELVKTFYVGDEELLSQVWVNLLHNAIKFTPEDGAINIAITSEDNVICVKISDTGIGISPEDQMHIFERFYKVDKARERALGGNGLGLSLVKKIVSLHGGHISIDSEIGKGTAFKIFLPNLHSV